MTDILFRQPALWDAFGRNGHSKALGIQVWVSHEDEVQLQPINSRKQATRCRIPVPREAIPALIRELEKWK